MRALMIVLVLLAGTAQAQERTVEVAAGKLTKRIVLLVDGSGSMAAREDGTSDYDAAVGEALWLLQQADDDVRFKLAVFYGDWGQSRIMWLRVEADPERDEPGTDAEGWTCLPSIAALQAAHGLMKEHDPNGCTPMSWAIEKAVSGVTEGDRGELSIVVLTDALPDGGDAAWGDAASHKVPIFVVKVGNMRDDGAIRRCAEETGGAYMRRK